MGGHRFIVAGDPAMARDTVYSVLGQQEFAVKPSGPWTASAERGSKAASIAFGALAGSKGRHLKLDIQSAADGQGNLVITIFQGTSGWSGGAIGKSQADEAYNNVYRVISQAFYSAGVLLGESAF
jgi:hypothetical protein